MPLGSRRHRHGTVGKDEAARGLPMLQVNGTRRWCDLIITDAAGTTRLSSATDGGWESPRDRALHHVPSSSEPTIDRHGPELYSVVGGPAPLDLRPRRESRSKRPRHTVAARPEPSLLARQHRKWNGRIFAKAGPKTTAGVEYSTRQNRRLLWSSATYRGPSPCGAPVRPARWRRSDDISSSDTEVRIAPTTSITPVGGMQTLAIEHKNYRLDTTRVSPRVERAGTTPSPDKEERNATMTGSRGLGIRRWGWRGIAFFVMDSSVSDLKERTGASCVDVSRRSLTVVHLTDAAWA
ncbi:hypothetical protein CMUS01_00418 [Colletotrichum musicola]|uniref:Uncharacterized protein n=1 Tax=Colletotrichum musicola TaxID=2175873 RepID=A0A8H6UA14_9PEZI|nr:hypothetical protein CMUS01_00418 [Colletotrichum musicola]